MYFTILDDAANAVDTFHDEREAIAALAQLVGADPQAADQLLLLRYDDEGNPVGAAMEARIAGRNEEAVAALTESAALEEERSQVGPPGDPTARELLGDLLLDLARFPEAAAAYDTALQRTPLRSPVLLGRARAAAKSGDQEGAVHWYGLLARNWKAADPDLPELAEVKAGAKSAQASR